MSKIGKQPINIEGVKTEISDGKITIEGSKGKLEKVLPPEIFVKKENNTLKVLFKGPKEKEALWGTWRSHIFNMVNGVKNGFEKRLKIEGVGWRANPEGKNLVLRIGFSHPVKITPPEGVIFLVEKDIIKILGPDKNLIGNVAAKIRKVRPPEPYKGKGIRYENEIVRRKAGKKAVAAIK